MIVEEDGARTWLRSVVGCDAACMDRLERFVALLASENERQNLVSAGSLTDVWVRHIADSAQLLALAERPSDPWLDLGTGAGFPGLVVALIDPGRAVILTESRARRAEWLVRVAACLRLPNVTVEHGRIERLAPVAAGVISARAFAPLDRLLGLAAAFSTPETVWLLPKGQNGFNELQQQGKAVRSMFHVEPSLTDPHAAILVGRGVPDIAARGAGR